MRWTSVRDDCSAMNHGHAAFKFSSRKQKRKKSRQDLLVNLALQVRIDSDARESAHMTCFLWLGCCNLDWGVWSTLMAIRMSQVESLSIPQRFLLNPNPGFSPFTTWFQSHKGGFPPNVGMSCCTSHQFWTLFWTSKLFKLYLLNDWMLFISINHSRKEKYRLLVKADSATPTASPYLDQKAY